MGAKGKALLVPPFSKKDIEKICRDYYLNNFGNDQPLALVDDEFVSIEELIAKFQNLTAEEVAAGFTAKVVNLIPGATIELLAVSRNHYNLANGQGKAKITVLATTILNEYTFLGLPQADTGDDGYLSNEGGYPTAQGLHEQLSAVYDKINNAFKDAIKLVEIPCYIPRYEISDAVYISKLFVPSATELGLSHDTDSNVPEAGDGTKYEYFDEGNGDDACEKRLTKFLNGEAGYFWTRTPYLGNPDGWYCVDFDGSVGDGSSGGYCGLAFAFCL